MKKHNSKWEITKKKILAVEGKDETNFFEAFLKHFKFSIEEIQIIDISGKDNFKNEIPTLKILPNFDDVEIIAFIRDAEEKDAKVAFQSIKDILKENNLPIPRTIKAFSKGPQKPKTGIFIMPDNKNKGSLEDLCLKTINGEKIESCINNYIECTEKIHLKVAKSKIQVYLASKEKIVNSLGIGAKKHFFNFNHSCFQDLKAFLENFMSI